MCSYNNINQTQAFQKERFKEADDHTFAAFCAGFVTSDLAATINGLLPELAGLDMMMPGF